VTDDPADRGLMGASFGAVSSLFTAWHRPGVFGRLILQSGSFVFTDVGHHGRSELWDPVVEFVNALRLDPARIRARVFLSCGTFEGLIVYNRSIAPLMRAAGLQVRFVESADGHNWIGWRDRLRDGLSWSFPGHLWMTYE
jgi:enterochelin esterase family protein